MARRFTDRGRAEHGFTLIEVLMTALIVTLIAGAVAGGLIASTDYAAATHSRSQAENLAQQDQERLKGFSAAELYNLNQTYDVKQDATTFSITSKAYYLSASNGQSCSSGGTNATYFKTISTVSVLNPTTGAISAPLTTDESVISPPAGGSFLAQFEDQTLSPLSGVTVAASGPDADTATTDTSGCVIFSDLPSGAYNLAYTDAGYVDKNGNAAAPLSDTTNVASTGQATPNLGNPIKLGSAGAINATFVTKAYNNSATPALTTFTTQAPELSWFGSGGSLAMSNFRTATGAAGLDSSIWTTTVGGAQGGLFPFAALSPTSYANNYQLWTGNCQQEQPPSGVNAATVTPGSVQNPLQVQEAPLYLVIKYSGSAVTPANVKLTFNYGSGSSCSETWGPITAPAGNGPTGSNVSGGYQTYVYGAPYATSSTTGSSASASGQTGTLSVCADHKVGSTWYHATTTGVTDSYTAPTLPLTPTIVNITTTTGSGVC